MAWGAPRGVDDLIVKLNENKTVSRLVFAKVLPQFRRRRKRWCNGTVLSRRWCGEQTALLVAMGIAQYMPTLFAQCHHIIANQFSQSILRL